MTNTHGLSNIPEYRIWAGMRQRCEYTKHKSYKDYGGRGVKVCARWQSFENFYADMGPRPEGATLERKDVNGNYEPENCCWLAKKEQSHNRSDTIYVTCPTTGETRALWEWAAKLGLSYSTLVMRHHRGYPPEKILRPDTDRQRKDNAKLLTYNGKTQLISEWAKELGIPYHRIWQRIFLQGYSVEETLGEPSDGRGGTRRRANSTLIQIDGGPVLSLQEAADALGLEYKSVNNRYYNGASLAGSLGLPDTRVEVIQEVRRPRK